VVEVSDATSPTVIGTVVGIGGIVVTIIGAMIRATWKAAKTETEIIAKIEKDRIELREQLTQEHSELMKQFGDSLSAVREKIRDNELWNRDNFVRRSDFQAVIESINRSVEALGTRMDAGLAKLDAKLDKLQMRS
jgi:translation initiation factor 2 alpha subunit (eIF-2alpha)